MRRTLSILALAACSALGLSAAAWAQTSGSSPAARSELSAQVSGVFTKSTTSNAPTTHLASNSAGLLLGYRLHLNNWEAIEVEYGYTRNGQRYFTPGTAPGAPATLNLVTANMQQAIANEVITTPRIAGIFEPFVLAGGGVVIFNPRSGSGLPVTSQTKGAFNYGVGVDFHIFHLGARAEYQGLIFKIPNFKDPLLTVDKWTHVAQPSVGLILTF